MKDDVDQHLIDFIIEVMAYMAHYTLEEGYITEEQMHAALLQQRTNLVNSPPQNIALMVLMDLPASVFYRV